MIGWNDDSRNILNWFGELYNGHKQLLFLEKRKDVYMYSLVFARFAAERLRSLWYVIIVVRKPRYRTHLLYIFLNVSASSYFRWVLLRDRRALVSQQQLHPLLLLHPSNIIIQNYVAEKNHARPHMVLPLLLQLIFDIINQNQLR